MVKILIFFCFLSEYIFFLLLKLGDLDFYMESFPDMKTLSTQLHNLGFRVTLWVHPFCNIDAQCFVDGANKGYWVKQLNSDLPGLTTWW